MVGCCNELNSGYAADGYARSSPLGVAVIVVTFMVGGLSALNAIAGACSERLKVIIVSGCPSEASFGQDRLIHHSLGIKDRDQPLRIFREVTTASVRLNIKEDPVEQLDATISQCLRDSLPVYIEIPSDLATLPCRAPGPLLIQDPGLPLRLSGKEKVTPALEVFIDSWKAAQKPVLIIGCLARRVVSPDMLLAFVEKLGCAVFCLPDGKSLVPETHPQFAGTFWCSASTSTCEQAVLESDLWVILGGRWSDLHTFGKIDLERESHRIVDIQDGVITTPGGRAIRDIPLDKLVSALVASDIPRNETTQWSGRCLPDLVDGDDVLNKNAPLSVPGILYGIQNILKPNDTLIAEAGDSWFNAQRIRLPQGADFQIQIMYGSIGWSLPATLGCQLARPDGRAVLMIGDGSFQMTAQELSTMIRMRSNSIIFIFNNLGYQIEVSRDFPPLRPPMPLCVWLIHTFFFRPQSTMVLITTSTTGTMPPLPVLCALQTTPSTSRILFYAARHTSVHICSLSRSRPPKTC